MRLKAFTSRRVVLPERIGAFALLLENEKIARVVPQEQIPPSVPVTDFGNSAILPGLVDSHIHINEPGRTEWEGFRTATRAAAAGGYTMLVDMPLNCVPSTTTVEALETKRKAAQGQCFVDWAAWGGVVSGNQSHIVALASAGVRGFKCFLIHPGIEEFTMVSEAELRSALPLIRAMGLPLLVHAELPGPVDAATQALANADWRSYETFMKSRPDEAELAAIELLLSLCREFGCWIHIVHLSTARALERLRDAKRKGLSLTVETCPHYLHLAAEEIADRPTQHKCAPPIRSRENREALWQGLRDGFIDLVATDHSPCPPAMKEMESGDFRTAWGGISGVSLALPIIWTEARRRGFTLTDVARWMAQGPARLAGCQDRKGRLAEGFEADFVVFDPEAEWSVSEAQLYYRHPVSPYLDKRLTGKVLMTFLRGDCVFRDGAFLGEPRGREYPGEISARHHN
ncbi:MAG TPA: allantoinase AllB [Candidatus Acidoferrum sp.]|nr:allantoinase AllB [Candidatus Acidoferrum sp.]